VGVGYLVGENVVQIGGCGDKFWRDKILVAQHLMQLVLRQLKSGLVNHDKFTTELQIHKIIVLQIPTRKFLEFSTLLLL
jgi:hypothetical protein